MDQRTFAIHTLIESNLGNTYSKSELWKTTLRVELPTEELDGDYILSMWFCAPTVKLLGEGLHKNWGYVGEDWEQPEPGKSKWRYKDYVFYTSTVEAAQKEAAKCRLEVLALLKGVAEQVEQSMNAAPEEETHYYTV